MSSSTNFVDDEPTKPSDDSCDAPRLAEYAKSDEQRGLVSGANHASEHLVTEDHTGMDDSLYPVTTPVVLIRNVRPATDICMLKSNLEEITSGYKSVEPVLGEPSTCK